MLPEDIDIISRAIAEVTAPLLERISELEARPAVKGDKGDAGERGEKGEPGLTVKGDKGDSGEKGEPGESVDMEVVKSMLSELVEKAFARIPVAKDGSDGVGVAGAVIDRDGNLVLTFSDGGTKSLGLVVGRHGEKGAPGADGLGFGDLVVEQDSERSVVIKAVRGEESKVIGQIAIPALIYRGVWRQGTYERGELATWAGSVWHCNETTTEKPGDGSKAWTLCVKKGGDGKQGQQGLQGERGLKGEQGLMGPARY